MTFDIKNIHIGQLLKYRVDEMEIDLLRVCNFLKLSGNEVEEMYQSETIETGVLLRWSKLLEYDFFRIYSQHLILFAPPAGNSNNKPELRSTLPQYRKNIYTKEIINFVLELINTGEKTKQQVVDDYRIPKATLYKWIEKHKK